MRLKGIENDCFLKLIASITSGLNLSETRVLITWFANALEYKITNQQIAFELSMKSSNVCRELASLCKKEWLIAKEVYKNKWEQPVTMYYIHPKRLLQIQEMVVEYTSVSGQLVEKDSDSEKQVPAETSNQHSLLEAKFNEFVKKYNLRERNARKDHGGDVCQYFFEEIKSQHISLEALSILKSKYIGLFCHKGKKISEEQYSDWKLQVANCWERNLEAKLGDALLKALRYVPNAENLDLIRSAFLEDDYDIALKCWSSRYSCAGFSEFKEFYIRDLDIEMQEGVAKDVLPPLPQFLESRLDSNKNLALMLEESISKSDRVSQMRSTLKKGKDAIVDENGSIHTEHLINDIPDEDDEGDPLYTPPEKRIFLKPEDCAPMKYDLEYCKMLGLDINKLRS